MLLSTKGIRFLLFLRHCNVRIAEILFPQALIHVEHVFFLHLRYIGRGNRAPLHALKIAAHYFILQGDAEALCPVSAPQSVQRKNVRIPLQGLSEDLLRSHLLPAAVFLHGGKPWCYG